MLDRFAFNCQVNILIRELRVTRKLYTIFILSYFPSFEIFCVRDNFDERQLGRIFLSSNRRKEFVVSQEFFHFI